MIKRFMDTSFPFVVNVIAFVSLALIVIGGLVTMFSMGFFSGLFAIVGGAAFTVLYLGMIYLFLDMRDILREVRDELKAGRSDSAS